MPGRVVLFGATGYMGELAARALGRAPLPCQPGRRRAGLQGVETEPLRMPAVRST